MRRFQIMMRRHLHSSFLIPNYNFSFLIILECRNQAVAEVVVDVVLYIFALENLDEFLVGRVVFVLFSSSDDVSVSYTHLTLPTILLV